MKEQPDIKIYYLKKIWVILDIVGYVNLFLASIFIPVSVYLNVYDLAVFSLWPKQGLSIIPFFTVFILSATCFIFLMKESIRKYLQSKKTDVL